MDQIIGQKGAAANVVKDSDTQNFRADVMDASMEVPVIVDFWAPWCGPCKQLGPILEKAVQEAKGAVRLVKINVDENQALAQQFRVQSIPAVYAFFQGRPVDGFMGAQPESQIKAFVQRLAKSGTAGPSPVEEALLHAQTLEKEGNVAEASALYREILAHEPDHAEPFAGLIRCYLLGKDLNKAKEMAGLIPETAKKHPKIIAALTELELAEKAEANKGALPALQSRLAANEKDYEARYELAEALFAAGQREEAVDHLLTLMRQNRQWNEEAARKQLLKFFDIMGHADPITLSGRRQLSSLLFS